MSDRYMVKKNKSTDRHEVIDTKTGKVIQAYHYPHIAWTHAFGLNNKED